jgi:hypothetical protein
MKLTKTNSRILAIESLEQRSLLAGNVTANVDSNGILHVTGDDQNNLIEIRQLAPSGATTPWPGARYELTSYGQVPTLINGHASAIVEGIKNGFTINMNGGDDDLAIFRPNGNGYFAGVPGTVNVDMGSGNDFFHPYITNHSAVNVSLGEGNDGMEFHGNVFQLTIAGDVPSAPAGDDDIEFFLKADGPVSIDAGGGNNKIVEFALSTSNSGATVNIASGNGADNVKIWGTASLKSAMRVETNGGDDLLQIEHLTTSAMLTINTAKGNDHIDIEEVSVSSTLGVWLGEGNDVLNLYQNIATAKSTLGGGDGVDTLGVGKDKQVALGDETITGFEIRKNL